MHTQMLRQRPQKFIHLQGKFKNITFDNAFLCGPEAMINTSKETLLNNGLNEKNIHFELFSVPIITENKTTASFVGASEITVIVDDEETTFDMDSKTTILTAALKIGRAHV